MSSLRLLLLFLPYWLISGYVLLLSLLLFHIKMMFNDSSI